MHAIQSISLLALAGSALAAPSGWGNWGSHWGGGNNGGDDTPATPDATEVAVVTAYTTVTWGGQWGPPTPTPSPAADSPWTGYSPSAPEATSAPPTSSAPSTPSSGGDGSYMDVVSEWRSKMGLSALTQDDTLQGNAQKTVDDSNGQMEHELNPGSFAQVLAPGSASDFENVFVGGWLCEVPSLPGLDGICNTESAGWSYGGETGHADILSSTKYSKIGCALATGIWACDLA